MTTNTPNAFGFIAAGFSMEALHFLPGVTGVRELWLLFMGGVLITMGTALLAQNLWVQMAPRFAAVTQSLALRRAEQHATTAASARGRITI